MTKSNHSSKNEGPWHNVDARQLADFVPENADELRIFNDYALAMAHGSSSTAEAINGALLAAAHVIRLRTLRRKMLDGVNYRSANQPRLW